MSRMLTRAMVFTFVTVVVATVNAAVPGAAGEAGRPVYEVGHRWRLSTGVFELTRITASGYVFTAGDGREIELTRDLVPSRLVRDGHVEWELDAPPALRWPLAVGAWGTVAQVMLGGEQVALGRSLEASLIWRVEAVEDVVVSGRPVPAFRIAFSWDSPWARTGGRNVQGSFTIWYSPERRELVKGVGDFGAPVFDAVDTDVAVARPGPLRTAPPAPRPAYETGDRWIRDDAVFVLVRRLRDTYVFADAGRREIHLTHDLALAAVAEDGRTVWSLRPAPALRWPLTVGDWGEAGAVLDRQGAASLTVRVRWRIDGVEDVDTPAGRFEAFRLSESWEPTDTESGGDPHGARGAIDVWYAAQVGQIVKARSRDVPGASFDLVASPPPRAPERVGSLLVRIVPDSSMEVWRGDTKVAEARSGRLVELRDVAAGVYQVRVHRDGRAVWTRDVEVTPDAETYVEPEESSVDRRP